MSPDRRQFLKSAGAAVAGAPALLGQRARRPNVLYLLADEWRAQSTGYNGDRNTATPVLDRLEAESVNFENAVSGCAVCCPYRASLLTGQYPLTNGVFINDVELKPKGPTLGETFRGAGYRTGFIGKWHVYGSPDGRYGRRLAYIPPEKRFGFDYWKACECTHEYNHSLYYEGNDPTPRYWPGYDAIAQTEDACGFLEKHSGADPFLLILSLGPPHFPYATAPERYREMYRGRAIQFRRNVPEDKRQEAADILRGYYAHMAALDGCFDRLLQTLERAGAAEDTIVVFTSDHGDMMLSQGLTTKLYPWDESIRVPFLLRYPRKLGRKGRRIPMPLNSPDIMPTLAAMCGLAIPDSVEGRDWSGLIAGSSGPPPDAAAFLNLAVPITEARRYGFAEYRGLRTARYTYVRSIRGPWLLYDNERDPFQMHNLCNRSEHRDLQSRLNRALDAALMQRKDEFLPAAEYVKRAGVGHYQEVNVPVGRHPSPWGDWDSTLSPG
ncbi:MAG TPA: sulfatase [Bryobacteraceae bacterium]|nr:sulfatase [Bryobacteraceae bacterium]